MWEEVLSLKDLLQCAEQTKGIYHMPLAPQRTGFVGVYVFLHVYIGTNSVVTCLKKGKNCCTTASGKEEWENVRGTTLQTSK